MTDQNLARASDIAVWSSMAVLALAMIAFVAYLAITGSAAQRYQWQRTTSRQSKVPAAVGGPSLGVPDIDPDSDESNRGNHWRSHEAARAGRGPDQGDLETGEQQREQGRTWGVIGLQLTWLATLGMVTALALRGLSVQRAPLGNMYEFALVASTFALVIYSVWSLRRNRLWLGLFITGPVLVILGFAMVAWYAEASQLVPSLNTIWLVIHVTTATLAVGVFLIGAVLAALYLVKDKREQQAAESGEPLTGWVAALPPSRTLERLTYGLHIIGFPLWTFTLIAGAIWAEHAWGRYWGWDPKEVWTLVIWVVYALYLHARATTGWKVRSATWLAIAGFASIIINYTVVNLVINGLHSYSGI